MNIKSRVIVGGILILIGIMAICIGVFIIHGSSGYEYGDVETAGLAEAGDVVVLEAVSFSITAEQLTEAAQMEILAGVSEEEAYAHAEKALVEKFTMYTKAKAGGIEPDEAAVRENLDYNREISKTAANYEDFQSFLDHIGMSHDEYWDSQYESFLMYDAIDRYKEILKAEFTADGKSEAEWEKHYAEIVADAVKTEKIEVVSRG